MIPRRAQATIAAVLLLAARAAADPAAHDKANLDYLKGAGVDAVRIASSPARWDRSDLLTAGAVVGGAGIAYAALDIPLQHAAVRNQSRVADRFADVGRGFGNGLYTVPTLVAVYLAGEGFHDSRMRRASLDAVESLAISGLFITAIKLTAGRARPYVGDGRGSWNGPSLSNTKYSFSSGHSAAAFSVATVFATEYGDVPGVAPASYALAALTGLSRIYNNQHWASDVIFGGALGYFTAKAVSRAHADKNGRWTFQAYPLEGGAGAAVALRFE
jgi:membrane-associated phospholipid phosphatase